MDPIKFRIGFILLLKTLTETWTETKTGTMTQGSGIFWNHFFFALIYSLRWYFAM